MAPPFGGKPPSPEWPATEAEAQPKWSPQLAGYRRGWLRVAIAATVVGYAVVLIALLLDQGVESATKFREPYVIAIGGVAAWLERRGLTKPAASMILGSLWLELSTTVILSGIQAPGGAVLPTLVLGAGLLLGSRAALTATLTIVASLPAAMAFHALLFQRSFLTQGDLVYLVILESSVVSTWVLLTSLMRAFGEALDSADQHGKRARALIDGAPDAIIALSALGKVEDCNANATSLLGLPREAIVGTDLVSLGLREQDSPSHVAELSRDTMSDTSREYRVERNGLILEGVLRTVPKGDGTRGALVVLRDITKRKQAEQRAAELQQQLLHDQKLKAIGQLAGGVAHDINNLLTAVGGYGDLLAQNPTPLVREAAAELRAARDRGTGLTQQLLTFARKELARPRGMDLAAAIGNMGRLLQRLVSERIAVVIEAHGPAVIFADPGQMEQVILNLAMNAKDAIFEAYGSRAPSTDAPRGAIRITCRSEPVGDRVELCVEDTGTGMAQATLNRIFEPFFTTKPRGRGTGLGLSTVHGIVQASGGTIEVHSTPGAGTTFTASWPRYDHIESLKPAPDLSVPRRADGHLVLLVEDDPQGRAFLTRLLNGIGCQVLVASDAREALAEHAAAVARGRPPDVLVSDVSMPGMTGFELARTLHQQRPDLPVLFLTGYLEQDPQDSAAPPFGQVLQKPFSTDEFLDRLELLMQLAPPRMK